jgi:hypothetical protein
MGGAAREEQYTAAIREAEAIVAADEFGFRLDAPGRPEVLSQWAFRYLLEFNAGITKKCPHGDWSRVHTIFGVEPNRAYCPECAPKRRKELLRDARRRSPGTPGSQVWLECDFCHQNARVVPVCFAIAAVVVRTTICARCLVAPSISQTG